MRYARNLGHSLVAILGLVFTGGAFADDDSKTITQKLIDADGRVALQKIEQDLNKGAAPTAAVSAAPNTAQVKAETERSRPRTIALYGVDGRFAGARCRCAAMFSGVARLTRPKLVQNGAAIPSARLPRAAQRSRRASPVSCAVRAGRRGESFEQRPSAERVNAARPATPLPQGMLPGMAPSPSVQFPPVMPQPRRRSRLSSRQPCLQSLRAEDQHGTVLEARAGKAGAAGINGVTVLTGSGVSLCRRLRRSRARAATRGRRRDWHGR